jgi:hypothetical protein
MSIHLTEEDRAKLKQLANRGMKPTCRQKAIASLDLSVGRSPAGAAERAGIPKAEVEALAARFAECGLLGVGLGGKSAARVRLIRVGVGVHNYDLPTGANLAHLLGRANATTTDQAVYLDGVTADETMQLSDGAVVVLVPLPKTATVDELVRATIPSFRDDALFRQYTESLKAHRRDLSEDEDATA